jgi:hypothetical protein
MIYYLVTELQTKPMRSFLEGWGKSLADRIKIVAYESLLAGQEPLPEKGGLATGSHERNASHFRTAIGEQSDAVARTAMARQ